MGKNSYRLLLIGSLDSDHIRRFILHLKQVNPEALIDLFCWQLLKPVPSDVMSGLESLTTVRQPSGIVSRIPLIRSTASRIRYTNALKKAVRGKSYDIINLHYPSPRDLFIIPVLKNTGAKIVFTPWGSDVLRLKGRIPLKKLRKLYAAADYVTGIKGRFMNSVVDITGADPGKILEVGIGSDILDYFFANGDTITRKDAKEAFGLSGSYVITCGYNGYACQRHKTIIESVAKVRDRLLEDLVLVFPFTYGAKKGYQEELEALLASHALKGLFVTDYLTLDRLLLLRKCADMFIHIQPTDANSSSVKEYVICGAKVLHGDWIVYDDLGSGKDKPYFPVPDIASLPDVILDAYDADAPLVGEGVLDKLRKEGWNECIIGWDNVFNSLASR